MREEDRETLKKNISKAEAPYRKRLLQFCLWALDQGMVNGMAGFSEKAAQSPAWLGKYSGKSEPKAVLKDCINKAFPMFNTEWWVTGEGEMIIDTIDKPINPPIIEEDKDILITELREQLNFMRSQMSRIQEAQTMLIERVLNLQQKLEEKK